MFNYVHVFKLLYTGILGHCDGDGDIKIELTLFCVNNIAENDYS